MRLASAIVIATVVAASTLLAHHSPAAFKLDSQVTIEGTVSRFDWTNPHVYIYLDTTSVTGERRSG